MYQSLRDLALTGLTDADPAFRISPRNATVGELFREMGEWEHAYWHDTSQRLMRAAFFLSCLTHRYH